MRYPHAVSLRRLLTLSLVILSFVLGSRIAIAQYSHYTMSNKTTIESRAVTTDAEPSSIFLPIAARNARLDEDIVLIPAGSFQMGCDPANNGGCSCTGMSLRTVYLDAYYINRTGITNAQYAPNMGFRCASAP